jgi:hypothetical protein
VFFLSNKDKESRVMNKKNLALGAMLLGLSGAAFASGAACCGCCDSGCSEEKCVTSKCCAPKDDSNAVKTPKQEKEKQR